jgi:hypothetical protein
MPQRRRSRHQILLPIRYTAVILSPSHLGDIGREIGTGDMMVDTDLGAANTREKRFHVIRANAFVGISPFVIDALREEAIVEHISQCGASSA